MICGDDTGLCKRVDHADGRVVVRWGEQALGAAVHRLCVRDSIVCAGRADGSVDVFELLADSSAAPALVHTYAGAKRAQVAGLAFIDDERLLVADAAGRIEVFKAPWTDGGKSGGAKKERSLGLAEAGAHTSQVRVDQSGARAASGGRDHELRLWDLTTMEVSWKARNVPEDSVRLAVPVWHADLAFSPLGPHAVVTASGFVEQRLRGEVRVYDVRAQRRPVMRAIAPAGDVALTALALSPDGAGAYVGTAKGDLAQLDLRRSAFLLGSLKGACGAVTAVQVSADGSCVFSASLDRHARVHSARSRKLLLTAYLKQKLRALALLAGANGPEERSSARGRAEEALGEEEEEAEARQEASAADAAAVEELLGSLARARDGLTPEGEQEEAIAAAEAAERKRAKRERAAARDSADDAAQPLRRAPGRPSGGGNAAKQLKTSRRAGVHQ